jgi:hypothetical protein
MGHAPAVELNHSGADPADRKADAGEMFVAINPGRIDRQEGWIREASRHAIPRPLALR